MQGLLLAAGVWLIAAPPAARRNTAGRRRTPALHPGRNPHPALPPPGPSRSNCRCRPTLHHLVLPDRCRRCPRPFPSSALPQRGRQARRRHSQLSHPRQRRRAVPRCEVPYPLLAQRYGPPVERPRARPGRRPPRNRHGRQGRWPNHQSGDHRPPLGVTHLAPLAGCATIGDSSQPRLMMSVSF